jgi:hypothetical protein
MTSYGSQYPTGNGPLYIDSDYGFSLTINRIFSYEKLKNYIWKFGTLLGYSAHATSRAKIQLLHLKTNVFAISDIISDPPISKPNITSSKPTRLGVDIQHFSILYEHSRTLTDTQSTSLNLSQQPVITT